MNQGQWDGRTVVLLVEPDRELRALFSAWLVSAGYITLVCGDGQTALTWLRQWVPDLVLLNPHLPDMPAEAFVAACRQVVEPHTPAVLVDGGSWSTALASALQAAAVLERPFDQEALVRVVRRLAPARG